jgi:tetratricopeptide (TPR) repeat protein
LVAQAQVLWAAGDQSAALLLLKGALARVESAPTGAKHDTADVAVLAREYASEALASGQTSEVLATLERLEPRLAGVADIWAIRGNAAQRLGRHAQAVAAYQQALALNPNEPRWLLGAAVSLAAMGQTLAATDMAEKVRVARALPPDVANYLRQLGVVIRPD